ncbi:maleylpyruvate isomerase N-terminal domain-containing protein [Nonomuraea sp. NPDC048826]|uniref:maleylpyruvate isomerase N-terminal domain-containing protein n=1 Tax=Nonomuraea sp. NPDC048826 TaxID=3364347 RepID=UPI00371C1248
MTDSYLFNGRGDHAASCPECGAALALLRGDHERAEEPPPRLREAVLSMARRRRQPAEPAVAEVSVPYAEQVALMDDLLAELSEPQWDAPMARHGTVRGLVEHLAANDARVARFMGVPDPGTDPVHRRWRRQAGSMLERVSASKGVLLAAEVELAGNTRQAPARGPLRHALIQRAFETWTHADDIRRLTDRPVAEPPEPHLRMIVEFGLAMLPRAVPRQDHGASATFQLTGPGGGCWTVPLSSGPGRVSALISAGAADFCRLLADRLPPESFPYAAEGDAGLARELIKAAATLGCD